MKARIAPALESLAVPIDSIQLHPRNPRQGDVGAISESLKRFGQQKPIVVQASTGFVVTGNHTLKAARMIGWERIAANVADMTDAEANAFALADNRTSDLGSYDDELLASILAEEASAGNLAGTGFDGDDVDAKVAAAAADRDPGPGLGNPIVSYTIVFDSDSQQALWFDFLRYLKARYANAESIGERLGEYLTTLLTPDE